MIQTYRGRRNKLTFLKEAKFGFAGGAGRDRFAITGGDDGRLFVWETRTGILQRRVVADTAAVNSVAPHPTLPMLASSGIDDEVKVWECSIEEPLDLPVSEEEQTDEGQSESEDADEEEDADDDMDLGAGTMIFPGPLGHLLMEEESR